MFENLKIFGFVSFLNNPFENTEIDMDVLGTVPSGKPIFDTQL